MKKITAIVSIVLGLFAVYKLYAAFFVDEHGKHISVNKNKVYYDGSGTEAEAQRLGSFLERNKFYDDGKQKDIQVFGMDSSVFVRLVVDKTKVNPEMEGTLADLTHVISDSVFNKKPVNIQLCDDKLKPYKTVAFRPAAPEKEELTEAKFNGASIFYNPGVLTAAEVKKLGDYLTQAGFFDGTKMETLAAKNEAGTYTFSFAVKPEVINDKYKQDVAVFGGEISKNAFGNAPVLVKLCNNNWEVLDEVPVQL